MMKSIVLASALLASATLTAAESDPLPPIRPAPAFTAAQLLAPPTSAWITNGGTLYNQRYSPLALLNKDNVKGLRALWRTAMGSGTTPGHGGQAQILVQDGTLYVANGANDVFAMDVETGVIRWSSALPTRIRCTNSAFSSTCIQIVVTGSRPSPTSAPDGG